MAVPWVALLLPGCALLSPEPPAARYWPEPPAQPYLVYETTLRSAASVTPASTESSFAEALSTSVTGAAEAAFVKPYDVAAAAGLIAVSDSLAAVVHVFDVPRRRLFQIGWRGEGKLQHPLGVALDAAQNIYVADAGLNQIVVFDALGHFKSRVGDPAEFARLSDVAVSPDGGRLYAVDRGGVDSPWHRVSVFSAQGELLARLGERGAELGQFNNPVAAAVAANGELYVLDAGNFRVQRFAADGQVLGAWGRPGNLYGNLARPRGIAVDGNGYVYITDAAFQNFQIFDHGGQLLLPVGRGGREDQPGVYALPAGIAVDETGRVYVVDQIQRKVEVIRLLSADERERVAKELGLVAQP